MNPRDIYYVYDDPVPFKNDLLIYPVSMRKYYDFFFYSQCLLLEKNSLKGDPILAMKAINMSYLEYLFTTSDNNANDSKNTAALFDGLLRLTLQLPEGTEIGIGYVGNSIDDRQIAFKIDEHFYSSDDFDLFRDIVSEQNELELPNENIQKDVRDSIEEARRYKAKMNNQKMAGLEDQIISVAIFSGWDLDKIYDLTIRKFLKTLKRADHMLHQKIYLASSLSGMVEFKDKSFIKSWLADIDERDDLSDTVDLNKIQNKVNMSEAIEKASGK